MVADAQDEQERLFADGVAEQCVGPPVPGLHLSSNTYVRVGNFQKRISIHHHLPTMVVAPIRGGVYTSR